MARATLRALAARQGRVDDPERHEEPGKILHEWWPRAPAHLAERGWPVRDGALAYYGSADATSWFLVVLASLGDSALGRELAPAWQAAGEWLQRALRRGDGLVRHGPPLGAGRAPCSRAGATPPPPASRPATESFTAPAAVPLARLADADCQAVAVAAARALAVLSGEGRHRNLADELAARVTTFFGPETIALGGDGKPVHGAGSQLGWLLWSGALGHDAAETVAERLCEPDVLTAFGLRTLSNHHCAFRRPTSCRRGRSARGGR